MADDVINAGFTFVEKIKRLVNGCHEDILDKSSTKDGMSINLRDSGGVGSAQYNTFRVDKVHVLMEVQQKRLGWFSKNFGA